MKISTHAHGHTRKYTADFTKCVDLFDSPFPFSFSTFVSFRVNLRVFFFSVYFWRLVGAFEVYLHVCLFFLCVCVCVCFTCVTQTVKFQSSCDLHCSVYEKKRGTHMNWGFSFIFCFSCTKIEIVMNMPFIFVKIMHLYLITEENTLRLNTSSASSSPTLCK